ncbi:hypothetical protein ACI3LY_000528 [Candidozyma auris]|uniref:Mitochondrial intermembrane space cysteine motif-containing protein MIX23 n=2 Tax=Candidozyma auris TaxID=498019 RepID=A0A0L0P1I5_CANAR|nr:hypothetical protein QG37_03306 [[Candida] auris]PIS57485.1 hypothetical protein CJI97_000527 [[Candida] auris]PIS58039.1 hypothetical protein B9J08_000525 [[Candida] auris]GBL50899.1 hypothetical protein CAJCM15448_31730 [[Candida] auris]
MSDFFYKKPSTQVSVAPVELLTSANCDDSSRIRAFLRLSRIATDDTISQHLNELKPEECDAYFNKKIVPQWQARAHAIQFCSDYAKRLEEEVAASKPNPANYDLRTNPYAMKDDLDKLEMQNAHRRTIENWVSNEQNVEKIIREETIKIFNNKCYYKDWLKQFKETISE